MLRKFLKEFEETTELPIEISELRDALISIGAQDEIIFSAQEMDTGTLNGVFYQYTTRLGVYADPILTTLIVYPKNGTPEIQRVICAKELIHICDHPMLRTDTPEEVEELAEKVVGPFEAENHVLTDLMAATDKLAQYTAINLLFPKAARELARQKVADGKMSTDEIAKWACIPVGYIEMMMTKEWETISEALLSLGEPK